MALVRQREWIFPEEIEDIKDVDAYLHKHYEQHYEESIARLADFENLEIDTLTVSDWTIETSFKPSADATVDLGVVGATDYRFRHLYLSGNLSDETNSLTVANAKTAYTHSQVAGGNSVHVSTAENTNWDSAYSHISATGTSHSYIDQSVVSGANVTFGTLGCGAITTTGTLTGGAQFNIEFGATGLFSDALFDDTSAGAANITIDAFHRLFRSTSASKYKKDVEDLELDSSVLYNFRPVSFNSLCERDDKSKRWIGLIADEIEQYCPEIVIYNKNNEAESYDNQMLMTLMLNELQEQNKRIEILENA